MSTLWISLASVSAFLVYAGSCLLTYRAFVSMRKETESVKNRVSALETHMLRFQQPEAIADDMEATADLIEARMAGRQAMPRPGSLPHARIAKRRDPRGKAGWDKSKP